MTFKRLTGKGFTCEAFSLQLTCEIKNNALAKLKYNNTMVCQQKIGQKL